MKQFLGISKRSHHSSLLKALGIPTISDVISTETVSTFQRIFRVNSPVLQLFSYMMAEYIVTGHVTKGTMLDRIIQLGLSPVRTALSGSSTGPAPAADVAAGDGLVDTLKYLVAHENFIKPWSDEHILTVLLTRCY